jgi:broad specificity phosphatase PhoE
MVYFVRHGETESNVKGVYAGQKDDSILTEKGKEQARVTGQAVKLSVPKVDRMISSSLKRTRTTAEIIAKEIKFDLNKIEIDDRIIEYDTGVMTGTPFKNASSIEITTAEGAEDSEEFRKRVYDCIKELSVLPETILVVSHGAVGRMLETIKKNGDTKSIYDIPVWDNASVTKIDWV